MFLQESAAKNLRRARKRRIPQANCLRDFIAAELWQNRLPKILTRCKISVRLSFAERKEVNIVDILVTIAEMTVANVLSYFAIVGLKKLYKRLR
ncbi:MAG: hypothetical protein SR1Q7_12635 [Quinella sp. 1Q7]|nr:hypothetical protein [Quinella sp. 1Q7]